MKVVKTRDKIKVRIEGESGSEQLVGDGIVGVVYTEKGPVVVVKGNVSMQQGVNAVFALAETLGRGIREGEAKQAAEELKEKAN